MTSNLEITLSNEPTLIPLKRLAILIGAHYQTLYAWVREGAIPYVRVGARVKFDGPTVAAWLAKRRVGSV